MSAEAQRREPAPRDEDLAQGKTDTTKLPRLLTGVSVVAIIVGSIWVLSGPSLPFSSPPPAPQPTRVAMIAANLPDEAGTRSAPRLGQLAPNFEWLEPDGSRHRLSDLRGSVVIINWWATNCPPCRAEMPALERVARSESNVIILELDLQEDEEQVSNFFERLELRTLKPIIDPNGETARRYAINALPQTFFLDVDGVIKHIEIGGPMTDDEIRRGIAKARGA